MDIIENITKIVQCFAAIVALVAAASAYLYISRFREKTDSATFSFWSQIRINILYLKEQLDAKHSIIDNMFGQKDPSEDPKNYLTADDLNNFCEAAKRLLDKLETTNDQIPAYIGWTSDITVLIQFLTEVLIYDIRDSEDKFKPVALKNNEVVTDYSKFRENKVSSILDAMNRLLEGIENNQKRIEKRISSKGLRQVIIGKALTCFYKVKDFASRKFNKENSQEGDINQEP